MSHVHNHYLQFSFFSRNFVLGYLWQVYTVRLFDDNKLNNDMKNRVKKHPSESILLIYKYAHVYNICTQNMILIIQYVQVFHVVISYKFIKHYFSNTILNMNNFQQVTYRPIG